MALQDFSVKQGLNIAVPLPISMGGTGQSTANTALNALLPSQSTNAGKYLLTDGTNTSWGTITGYSAPTIGTTLITSGGTFTTLPGVTSINGATVPSSGTLATTSQLYLAPTIGTTSIGSGSTVSNINGVTINSTTIPTSKTLVDTDSVQTLTNKTLGSTISLSANLNASSNKIINLATPTSDQDAATKAYVDAATAGLNVHDSVKAATTTNINLSTDLENGDILDGVTLATGNRVLVKNQTTKSQNGVYIVQASGAAVRAEDYNTAGEVDAGDFIFVEGGTVNAKTGWVQVNAITTLGSDNIEFTQFSGAGTYTAGTGLTLSGTEFSLTNSSITINGSAISLGGTVDTYPSLSSSQTLSIAGLAENFDQNLPPGPIPPVFTITYNAGSPPLSQSSLDIAIDEGMYLTPGIDPLNSAAPNSNFTLDLTSSSNGSAVYTLTGLAFFDNISNIISIPASYVSGTDYSTGVTVSAGDIDYSVSAAGKYLTNDGTTTSWASVDALPSQSGNSGNFLTTDGTNASWTAAPSPSTATTTNFGTLIGSTSVSGSNVSLGYWALQNNTTGSVNTAIGYTALYANTEGGSNTALGYSALGGNTIGSGNIAIGRYTSYLNTDGSSNNAIGEEALKSNISGNYNNALGKEALYAATGSSNVGLGHRAAYSLTTGSNNIVIGSTAEPSTATISNEITLGNASITSFRIPGLSLTVDSSNPIVQLTSTQTLTNKTLSSATLTGTLTAGGGVGTNGQVLQSTGTGVQWGTISSYSAPTIGTTSITSGGTFTTLPGVTSINGATVPSSGTLATLAGIETFTNKILSTTSTTTINTNNATTIDTTALSGFTSMKFFISIKQGSKIRSSELIVQTDGTTVDHSEYSVVETGGLMNAVSVVASVSSTNCITTITIGNAATTNATVKIFKVLM